MERLLESRQWALVYEINSRYRLSIDIRLIASAGSRAVSFGQRSTACCSDCCPTGKELDREFVSNPWVLCLIRPSLLHPFTWLQVILPFTWDPLWFPILCIQPSLCIQLVLSRGNEGSAQQWLSNDLSVCTVVVCEPSDTGGPSTECRNW